MEGFECGDAALDSYLKRHAWNNQEQSLVGVSYVAVNKGAPYSVLGHFTLAMASAAPLVVDPTRDIAPRLRMEMNYPCATGADAMPPPLLCTTAEVMPPGT